MKIEFDKKFWKQYLIASIIVSLSCLIIFPMNKVSLAKYFPYGVLFSFSGVLVLGLFFALITAKGEKNE